MSNSTSTNTLYIHEWMAIVFIIVVLAILTVASHSCEEEFVSDVKSASHSIVNEYISVYIEGEVEFSGEFSVKRGFTLKELFLIAKPKVNADLRHHKFDKVLRKGERIKVLPLEYINIILRFHDKSFVELTVPKGARFEDLPSLYMFKEGMDLSWFQKKRRLKDNEVIKIPQKTQKGKISIVKKSPLLVISYFKHKKICF